MAYKAKRVWIGHLDMPDRVGLLAEAAAMWKEDGVDFRALVMYSLDGKAYIIASPKDLAAADACAAKVGLQVAKTEGIFVKGDDEMGALIPVAEALAAAGVNIVSMISAATGGKFGACFEIAPDDFERACAALSI